MGQALQPKDEVAGLVFFGVRGGFEPWRAARVLRVRSIIIEKCCLCATLFVYLAGKI